MATDRFVSPGVFTRENDLTFLPQGIAEIGGAFIGPTTIGPAFVPTTVQSADEFRKMFGDPTPNFYTGHAAVNYLKDAARATIVRVLGLGGYAEFASNYVVLSIASGTVSANGTSIDVEYPVSVIFPTRNSLGVTPVAILSASLSSSAGAFASSSTNFNMQLWSSNGLSSSFTALSLQSGSSAWFADAVGGTPAGAEVGYTILNFPRSIDAMPTGAATPGAFVTLRLGGMVAPSASIASASSAAGVLPFAGQNFDGAETPWIQSQTIGGKRHNLFKVHTFADGNASNTTVKVSITNTRPATSTATDQHGTFGLIVRTFDDTDSRISVLEQFDNLSLNPDSPDYVARRIGDMHWTVNPTTVDATLDGEWANNSKYIWVEMLTGIENIPDRALPAGFAQLRAPALFSGVGLSLPSTATGSFITTRYEIPVGASESVANSKIYYGWDFTDVTNKAYLNPIPTGAPLVGSAFNLENVDSDVTGALSAGTIANGTLRKFSVPMQYGFDGLNPSRVLATGTDIAATNTQGFDLSLSTTSGSAAYSLAIALVGDSEAYDINMLVVPGVLRQLHSYVAQIGIDMCENRGDCFYIMDGFAYGQTVAGAVTVVAGLDTNYAGVYHPWVKIFDSTSNKNMWVPPSVVMAGVFAFNDKVAAEWFAPAGLNRGGIDEAIQVEKRLSKSNRDDLYDGRVNPIAMFPGQGIVAFGQKTLQIKTSALDRINVRRLLIAVKKFLASAANFLVFEQNVESTRQRFLNIANPYLASIQERSGLYAFKVVMDASNNTPDMIDRNILVGQIYLQPTRTAEFISLEFNILPTGATFPEGA